MSTKLSTLGIEKAHFNNVLSNLPNSSNWCGCTINNLLNMGLIQVSTAVEHAIANVGGHTVVSENEFDLSDGSEVKSTTARHRDHNTAYDACVSNIKGKTGTLRVQIYERIQDKFYYFVIPHENYKQVKYLEIPFTLEGDPKTKNKWWNYQVCSFEQLSA
jgi:hypothetical protein